MSCVIRGLILQDGDMAQNQFHALQLRDELRLLGVAEALVVLDIGDQLVDLRPLDRFVGRRNLLLDGGPRLDLVGQAELRLEFRSRCGCDLPGDLGRALVLGVAWLRLGLFQLRSFVVVLLADGIVVGLGLGRGGLGGPQFSAGLVLQTLQGAHSAV